MDFSLLSVFVTAIVAAGGVALGWIAVNSIIVALLGE